MKTTVEIPDALLEEARRVAVREGTTVRALVEEGLRRVLSQRTGTGKFQLRRASFKGRGLQAAFAEASWDQIRDAAYDKHGA